MKTSLYIIARNKEFVCVRRGEREEDIDNDSRMNNRQKESISTSTGE
jgi:hypothetical protein